MVVEVSELHAAREPTRRPRRLRDPAHVGLVGLAWSVRQKLQGVQLNTGEALVCQPSARGGTELKQVVEKCRGVGVWRDSGRDPREMVDDRIAEAVALAFVFLTGNGVRERGVHGRSLRLQLHFDLLALLKVLTELTTLVALLAIAAIWVADGLAGSAP
jgi:hypothetical protein